MPRSTLLVKHSKEKILPHDVVGSLRYKLQTLDESILEARVSQSFCFNMVTRVLTLEASANKGGTSPISFTIFPIKSMSIVASVSVASTKRVRNATRQLVRNAL